MKGSKKHNQQPYFKVKIVTTLWILHLYWAVVNITKIW